MEAISILAPKERCVRSKLQLFLRLWTVRQKYESLKPFGGDKPWKRIQFHLQQLKGCWDAVVEVQKAMGMEVDHFTPADKFELIYVISAFVDRELRSKENTLIGIQTKWSAYQVAIRRLNYELNRYDFSDACKRCHEIVTEMAVEPEPTEAEVIPFRTKRQMAHGLKMADEVDYSASDSGESRYSPGGRFS